MPKPIGREIPPQAAMEVGAGDYPVANLRALSVAKETLRLRTAKVPCGAARVIEPISLNAGKSGDSDQSFSEMAIFPRKS